MTRFRPYPSYKDSGVEWLGKIPADWEKKKVSHTSYVKGRIGWQGLKSDEFIDEGPYLVTGTDFDSGHVKWASCYHVSEDRYKQDPYIQLRELDLLITKDGSIGKVAVVKGLRGEASLNSGIFLVRPLRGAYKTTYMYWVLNSMVFGSFIDYTSTGTTIDHLYQNVFERFWFGVPSPAEQDAIAAFLDRETKRIDALVEKKEKLVELLQEKRAALISHAVTKGLDPNVRLKDSGVEWLGKIPEHWDYSRMGHLILSTNAGEVIDKGYWHDGDELLFTCQKTPVQSWFTPFPEWKRTKAGDVLLTRNGTPYAFLPPADAIYTNVVQRVRLHARCLPEFAFLVLNQAADSMRGFGDIIESFNMGVWRETVLPLPPKEEQKAIVARVGSLLAKADAMVEKVRRSIELLKEYRTALISAAVTGKIDVREKEAV